MDQQSSRACLRCIARKRRCDHALPSCKDCIRADESCSYPPDRQKRGPLAGMVRTAEARALECEGALQFLLGLEGVEDLLRKHSGDLVHNGARRSKKKGAHTLPSPPTSHLDRPARAAWWQSNPLQTVESLLELRQRLADLGEKEEGEEMASEAHLGVGSPLPGKRSRADGWSTPTGAAQAGEDFAEDGNLFGNQPEASGSLSWERNLTPPDLAYPLQRRRSQSPPRTYGESLSGDISGMAPRPYAHRERDSHIRADQGYPPQQPQGTLPVTPGEQEYSFAGEFMSQHLDPPDLSQLRSGMLDGLGGNPRDDVDYGNGAPGLAPGGGQHLTMPEDLLPAGSYETGSGPMGSQQDDGANSSTSALEFLAQALQHPNLAATSPSDGLGGPKAPPPKASIYW